MSIPMLQRGQTLEEGRYVLRGPLGEGGMGAIWLATDTRLETDVVVKVPHREMLHVEGFAERFQNEIRALIGLSHRHASIVQILGVGSVNDLPYAVMQHLGGGSLLDLSQRVRKLPADKVDWRRAVRWLEDIADALDFIHAQGVLHRDVKPQNILFDEAQRSYLADFGVVKRLADDAAISMHNVTQTNMMVGSMGYLAKEVLAGEAVDGRADQYALAVTVYEFLSGNRPYDAPTPVAMFMRQQMANAKPLQELCPQLPDELWPIVKRALHADADQRFATCSEFADSVLEILPSRTAHAARPDLPPASRESIDVELAPSLPDRALAPVRQLPPGDTEKQRAAASAPTGSPPEPTPPPVSPVAAMRTVDREEGNVLVEPMETATPTLAVQSDVVSTRQVKVPKRRGNGSTRSAVLVAAWGLGGIGLLAALGAVVAALGPWIANGFSSVEVPVAQADPYEFNMGEENTFSVRKGERGLLDNDQPPGQLQVVRVEGGNRTDSWTPLRNYPGVDLQVFADGSFKLDVSKATDLIALPQGATREITFSYLAGTLGDKPKVSSPTEVTVTVWGINDLPIAKADKYELSASDPFSPIKLSPLRRVEDPDTGDQHAVVLIAGQDAVSKGKVIKTPLGGEVEVMGRNLFLYFPSRDRLRSLNASQTYIDEFTYAVQDSAKETPVEGTITVTSPGVDLPPIPKEDLLVLKKGETQLAFSEEDLKKNDENAEGGELQLVAINKHLVRARTAIPTPGKGVIIVAGGGRMTYRPSSDRDPYNEFNDVLEYKVRSSGGEGVGKVVIKIEAIPRPIPVTTLAEDFFNEMATAQYPLPEGFGRKTVVTAADRAFGPPVETTGKKTVSVLELPNEAQRGPADANVLASLGREDLVPTVQFGIVDVIRTEATFRFRRVDGPAGRFVLIANAANQPEVPVAHLEFRQRKLHFYWDGALSSEGVAEALSSLFTKQLRVSVGQRDELSEEHFQFFKPIQMTREQVDIFHFDEKSRLAFGQEPTANLKFVYQVAFSAGDNGRFHDLKFSPGRRIIPVHPQYPSLLKYLERSSDRHAVLPQLEIVPVDSQHGASSPGTLSLVYNTFDSRTRRDQGPPLNRETTWTELVGRTKAFKRSDEPESALDSSTQQRYLALAAFGEKLSYSLNIHVAIPADQGKGQLLLLVPKSIEPAKAR